MVADEVDDRRMCAPGVMQVRDSIRKSRTQVSERQRRPPRHSAKAICGAGADALEETQHGASCGCGVQGLHEGELRRSRIRETNIDPEIGYGSYKRICAGMPNDRIHFSEPSRFSRWRRREMFHFRNRGYQSALL